MPFALKTAQMGSGRYAASWLRMGPGAVLGPAFCSAPGLPRAPRCCCSCRCEPPWPRETAWERRATLASTAACCVLACG
jgi:hypothetical protein